MIKFVTQPYTNIAVVSAITRQYLLHLMQLLNVIKYQLYVRVEIRLQVLICMELLIYFHGRAYLHQV